MYNVAEAETREISLGQVAVGESKKMGERE